MSKKQAQKGSSVLFVWFILLLFVVLAVSAVAYIVLQMAQRQQVAATPSQPLPTAVATADTTAVAQVVISQTEQALETLYQTGLAYKNAGDYQQAYDAFNRLLVMAPTYADASAQFAEVREKLLESYYNTGKTAFDQALWGEAIIWFDKVMLLDPAYLDTSSLRIQALAASGATPTASSGTGESPDTSVPTETPAEPEPTATALPTFTPTPNSIPQFYDSFDAGINPEWDYYPDDWGTVNGQLVSLRNGVNIWIGDETWQNYAVEMDMVQSKCSLYILQTRDDHYLFAELYYADWITWFKDGSAIPNTKTILERVDQPYTVRVTTQNNTITTFVNGEQLNQFSVNGYQSGKIGLYCPYDGSTIDNFLVNPLP